MRLYPPTSLRDWRDECERSQQRAEERRQSEPFVPSWAEAILLGLLISALLVLAYVAIPVAK